MILLVLILKSLWPLRMEEMIQECAQINEITQLRVQTGLGWAGGGVTKFRQININVSNSHTALCSFFLEELTYAQATVHTLDT